jgi:hypothetical protein
MIPGATYKLYKFKYKSDPEQIEYVGVIAQEVQRNRPDAIIEGKDGYLAVNYSKLGMKMMTYEEFLQAEMDIEEIAQAA